MVSPVQTGGHFAASKKMNPPRFQGQKEYEQFKKEFEAFPADSLDKLEEIKQLSGKPQHIKLARQYAKEDPHVRQFNQYVDTFINQRQKDASQHKQASYLTQLGNGLAKVGEYIGLTTPKPTGQELLNDLRKALGEVLEKHKTSKAS